MQNKISLYNRPSENVKAITELVEHYLIEEEGREKKLDILCQLALRELPQLEDKFLLPIYLASMEQSLLPIVKEIILN